MLKICSLISVLFSILLLIGCISIFQAPQLEFVRLRHFQLQDTILFKEMSFPYLLSFTSDRELENSADNIAFFLLYASAQNQGYNYNDVIQWDGMGDEVFSTVSIKKIEKRNGKYYYAAALYPTISKEDFINVHDTVYCKIFYVRMFLSIPQTEEMKIPKDSLNILFE